MDAGQLAHDVAYYVTLHSVRAALPFLQRDSYLYWPFLASTLLLAVLGAVLAARYSKTQSALRMFREYFRAGIWWHPSARADYRLYLVNALVLPLLFSWLLVSDARVINTLAEFFGTAAGGGRVELGLAAKLLYTLLFYLVYDFGRFVAHCLLHDVPILWEFHKVHHTAEVLTPMTAYRAHPLDLLLMALVPTLLTGVLTWIFNALAGGRVSFYSFLGLHAVMWAFNLIDNLKHSNVWLTYGPRWGRWLISPAHHQLHHSYEPRHMGCNRGFTVALWDRLYGTLYVPSGAPETFRLGIGDGTEREWHGVWRMYWRPFALVLRRLRKLPEASSATPNA